MSFLTRFAQTATEFEFNTGGDTNTFTSNDAASAGVAVGIILISLLLALVLYVFISVCLMKVFRKAGRQDAWAAFVPFYNMWVYFEVAGRPGWWGLLGLIPFVGGVAAFVVGIIGSIDMAKSFGKSTGYGILLALLPFIGYPMLAFGDATYQGPAGPEGGSGAPLTGSTPPQQPTVQPVQ